MQVSESDIAAIGQNFFAHGARAAEIDRPFAVRNLSSRHEEMPHQHGGQSFLVCGKPRAQPAAHFIVETLVLFYFFLKARLGRIGTDRDIYPFPLIGFPPR